MECVVCLENTDNFSKEFTCEHINYHKDCIKLFTTCPMCRAPAIPSNRILIWNENNRAPALIYMNSHNLNHMKIVIIKSMDEFRPGDIVYNFRNDS